MLRWMLAVLIALGLLVTPAVSAASPAPTITVVSNTRADLVSDGQALVAITGPTKGLKVTLGKRDITKLFAQRSTGRVEGLVDGLRMGTNVLTAKAGGIARLTITNHPNGGPIFGGPQVQPWRCHDGARDKQCNRPAAYTYLYKSSDPRETQLLPYNPKSPPSDVATATTESGAKVPFVVRQELGYLARDQYKILTLFDPKKPWTRWAPQKTFNHKVLVPGGGGCGGDYSSGGAPLDDFAGTIPEIPGRVQSYVDALERGYAVMSTALANTGHNCNVATEAEALIMLKERLIERYGDVRFTIGTGCSGGSIVQHTVANAYPGAVYDGLVVTCAYPDTFSAGAQFADYHMLRNYFENPEKWGTGVVWTPQQWAAVEGHATHVNAIAADELLFKEAVNPVGGCVPAAQAYSPAKPGGVRCSILDFMKTLLGPRPKSVWTAGEKKIGRGFAGIPFSNSGIQYGLGALTQGLITPEMFVDLNEKIGGLDVDAQVSPKRLEGDNGAVANTYRTGLMNGTENLDTVAIINHAGPDPGIAHDYAHTMWTRDRLDKANGHHKNQVIWFGASPLIGDLSWPTEAFKEMDRWLTRIKADTSARPIQTKVVANKPSDITDRCAVVGTVHVAPLDGVCLPEIAKTRFGSPREVAGGPQTNDILKCQLRAIRAADYGLPGLLPGHLERLKKVFPRGVCDWNKRGVGMQPVKPWQTYADSRGRVVYGGKAMPPAPRSHS